MTDFPRRYRHIDLGRRAYAETLKIQMECVARMREHPGRVWLITVEHDPSVITLGRRARREHILATPERLAASGVEVYESRRGGDVTWHGWGQLVLYVIAELDTHCHTIRQHVRALEQAVMDTLRGDYGLDAQRRQGLTGVWIGPAKISALGVAIDHWIAYHGLSLNVARGRTGANLIVPCGLNGHPVTDLETQCGHPVPMDEIKTRLLQSAIKAFELAPGDVGGDTNPIR